MIKSYNNNGKEFQTITIPKGTALFRGKHFKYDDNVDRLSLFHDLIGIPNNSGHGIAPTYNVFFYPAPYVSNCIQQFNVHIIYITNYDLELYLLIKPSKDHRGQRKKFSIDDVLTECTNIAKEDKCGGKLNNYDLCISDMGINIYPNIAGYIAIADNDAQSFISQYELYVHHGKKHELMHIMPCISSNSRGIISVPEIVIHPLHLRKTECFNIRDRLYNSKSTISYCIRQRAQYNFFPLLYIDSEKAYSLYDLMYEKNIDNILNTVPDNKIVNNKLLKILKRIMNKLLSEHGYKINNHDCRLSIDMRSGFYIFENNGNLEKNTYGKLKILDIKKNQTYIVPFSYSLSNKSKVMKSLSNNGYLDLKSIEQQLNSNDLSMTYKYVLTKGNEYKHIFHVDNVLIRKDIKPVSKKQNSKIKDKLLDDLLKQQLGLI